MVWPLQLSPNPHCSRRALSGEEPGHSWSELQLRWLLFYIYIFLANPLLVLEISFLGQIVTKALFLRSSLFGVAVLGCLILLCLRFIFFEKKKKGFCLNLRNPSVQAVVCIFCGCSLGTGSDFWFTIFCITKEYYGKQQRNFRDF